MKILNRGKDSKDTESFNKIKVNDEPSLKLLNSILNEESNLGNRSISENSTIFRLKSDDVKLIAFYLPQFHQIPENDKWWGEGFTEWTNVKKAIPQFKGHYQPHIPGELGYYNLTNKEVMKRQIELAKQYGIYGFCFHHYWFAGKRLLEKPVNMLIENKDLDIPFCLCWANENWTRRWDGLDNEVLIAQKHSPEDDINFIEDISKYFNDTRYIKIDEKPVLIVYRIELFPNPEDTIVRWRKWMEDHGYKGIYLIGAQGFACKNPTKYGLDAAVEFPPNGMHKYNYISSQVSFKNPNFKGNIVDYSYYVNNKLYLKEDKEKYNLFKTIIPSWDNTPRRGNKSTIFYNSSPELYKQWLKDIIIYTKTKKNKDEQFVFINAWNEWGEGAYLEPDVKYGYSYLNSTKEAILETRKLNKKILYVSHDTKYGGAQLLSLNIIKYLKEKFKYDISIIAINCGWFEDEFKKYGDFYNVDNNLEKAHSIIKKLRNSGVDIAICNTVISGDLVKLLKNENYKVITLIHELSGTIKAYNAEEKARNISIYSDTIIFPSKYVKDEFKDIVDKNIENKSKIIPQGVFNNKREYKDKKICTKDLKEKLNISQNSKIVLGVGYGDKRKGIDLFIDIANEISKKNKNIYFIWIGPIDTNYVSKVCSSESLRNKNLIFENFTNDLEKYYLSSDLYLLTSREDPFPSVVLESMYYGLPVVGFNNAGGFVDIVKHNDTGFIVDFEDLIMTEKIIMENIFDKTKLNLMGQKCMGIVEEKFNFYDYIYKLLELLEHKYEKVSVIVPNYNYEHYIIERLKSIDNQTYPIYEIIYLDDASTDNSNEKVINYIDKSYNNIIIDLNLENSGNVFSQWKKGISKAKGDYIWIAEADDLSDRYFLENIMKGFEYDNVVISYSQSKQINEAGSIIANEYLYYTNDVDIHKWSTDYVNNGVDEIKQCMSIKNTIPNISAVVVKKVNNINVICSEIDNYKVAGDWLFYINLLEIGNIYFCSKSLNYHRRHEDSIVKTVNNKIHFNEIVAIQNYISNKYDLSKEISNKVQLYRTIVKKYLKV